MPAEPAEPPQEEVLPSGWREPRHFNSLAPSNIPSAASRDPRFLGIIQRAPADPSLFNPH